MDTQPASTRLTVLNLRIWRDERLEQLWRLAYDDGGGETIVSFPDTAALSDFIAECLGLDLGEDHNELMLPRYIYLPDEATDTDMQPLS
jgi:hypothetical protein